MFVRWDNLKIESEAETRLPGLPRGGHSDVRRARGVGHPLLRGLREVRDQQGAGGIPHAVPIHHQSVPGMLACLQILLRAPDAHVPRLQRRPRLREGDRRQGQRARGPAGRAAQALVEGRAHRDGDEHRPVPVGRVAATG